MFTVCRHCNLSFRKADKVCSQCGCRTENPTNKKRDFEDKPWKNEQPGGITYGGSESVGVGVALAPPPVEHRVHRIGNPVVLRGQNGKRLRGKTVR